MNALIWSVQFPLFKQGLLSHSFVSAGDIIKVKLFSLTAQKSIDTNKVQYRDQKYQSLSCVQTEATTPDNVGQFLANNIASVCMGLKVDKVQSLPNDFQKHANDMQQGVQTDAILTCNIQQCCVHSDGALRRLHLA